LLRVYAVNDEPGLVICTWPRGERPGYAFYFADEVWCGIEYQVASHMIYEGIINEGLAVAMGVRKRHRGDRRNPWNEFECGHHYSRSMASYTLMLALSGFRYSAPEKRLGFSPRIHQEKFKTYFSTAAGWGLYSQNIRDKGAEMVLDLKYGSLCLNRLDLPSIDLQKPQVKVTLEGKKIKAQVRRERNRFTVFLDSVLIEQGEKLRVYLGKD